MGLTQNFVWMLSNKLICGAASVITAGLINRSLGPSGRGFYAEMLTWITLFMIVFGFSMDSAIYHCANEDLYGKNKPSKFMSILLLTFSYSLLAVLSFSLFIILWPDQVSLKTRELSLFLNILLISTMFFNNSLIFMQAINRIVFTSLVSIFQSLASILIILYGYFFRIIDIMYVVANLIIVQFLGLVILFFEFIRLSFLSQSFSKEIIKVIIKAGLKQHIATISTFLYTKINQIIVFKYCGASEGGLFAVALTLSLYLMVVPMALQTVLYPRVIHSKDDYEVTVRCMRIGFYGWGTFVLLIILLADPILRIYGGIDFLHSKTPFRILMMGVWLFPLSAIGAPYYVKKGAFLAASFSSVLLGIISISLNLVLIPRYFSVGAAIATTLTFLSGFCMSFVFLRYLSGKNPFVILKPDFREEITLFKVKFLKEWMIK